MLLNFDEKTKKVVFDTWAVENVPEFRDLNKQYGRDAFEVVAMLVDYRSFYRHLGESEKKEQIIKDWPKRRDTRLVLTREKLAGVYFKRAIEKYLELNYDPLYDAYTTLQAVVRKKIEEYRTENQRTVEELEEEAEDDADPNGILADEVDKPKRRKSKAKIEEDRARADTIKRQNIEDSLKTLDEWHSKLFEKVTRKGDNRMKFMDFHKN